MFHEMTLKLYFMKRLERKISQCILPFRNSQENTCARVSFNKYAGLRPATLLKNRLWHRCFPVKFAKFLRTPFIIEHLWWLLLLLSSTWLTLNIFKIILTITRKKMISSHCIVQDYDTV